MERIAIIDGIRTPFCKMGTSFNNLSAQELGQLAAHELIERSGFDVKNFDEVIFGCVGQPADAANVARVIGLLAGVPKSTPAFTVHRNCASGIEAVTSAAVRIQVGEGRCMLVGGAESMSNIPFFLSKQYQEILTGISRAKTPMERLSGFLRVNPMHRSEKSGESLSFPVDRVPLGSIIFYPGIMEAKVLSFLSPAFWDTGDFDW